MRLLVVASDRMEFAGLIAGAAKVEASAAAVNWSRRVWFGDREALLAANGVGAAAPPPPWMPLSPFSGRMP
jgi:hypothetical protein